MLQHGVFESRLEGQFPFDTIPKRRKCFRVFLVLWIATHQIHRMRVLGQGNDETITQTLTPLLSHRDGIKEVLVSNQQEDAAEFVVVGGCFISQFLQRRQILAFKFILYKW